MDPMQAITDLQAQVAQLQAEVQFLRSIPTTPSQPKLSLPDPEKFNGQSHKFDTWLPSIKGKLRVDNAAIGDSIAQFYYVFLNLDSHVQAIVLPQLQQAEESDIWDYNTILDQLTLVFDNPNKVQHAEDRLLSLRQGRDSAPTYISKFERILYVARGQNWPDINKISIFRNGLNSTIRDRLSEQLNLPQRYPDFVRIVQQLASQSSSSTVQPSDDGSETTDIGGIAINSINIPSPRFTPRSTPTQSTSSLTGSRARSISPACREQYRSEGRCLRCGSHDHWVRSCPLQPYKKQKAKRIPTSDQKSDKLDLDAGIRWLQKGRI